MSGREFLDEATKTIEGRGPALQADPEDPLTAAGIKVRDDIEQNLVEHEDREHKSAKNKMSKAAIAKAARVEEAEAGS
eukprot:10210383-Lingulodinium_polyedra.AAC.1